MVKKKTQKVIKQILKKHWKSILFVWLIGFIIGLNIPLPKGQPIMTATIKVERVVTPTVTPTKVPTATPTPAQAVESAPMTQTHMLQLVNTARAQAGLAPLYELGVLDYSAQIKAQDMNDKNYFSHTTPDGKDFSWSFRAAGFWNKGIAENLGKGYNDDDALFQAFMNSPEHRENILEPKAVSFGFARVGNYGVMHFGGSY